MYSIFLPFLESVLIIHIFLKKSSSFSGFQIYRPPSPHCVCQPGRPAGPHFQSFYQGSLREAWLIQSLATGLIPSQSPSPPKGWAAQSSRLWSRAGPSWWPALTLEHSRGPSGITSLANKDALVTQGLSKPFAKNWGKDQMYLLYHNLTSHPEQLICLSWTNINGAPTTYQVLF